jgi:succinyl-CoA synthetase beta subunit
MPRRGIATRCPSLFTPALPIPLRPLRQAPRFQLESRAAMDLLEYQGKQLFARHGLSVSAGKMVESVEDAVAAADEVGYPVVVKAQVLIGGRGKAGGVKLAADEAEAREHAGNILGMDIHGHTVRKLWIEHASDIASEYYASVLLDRQAKQPLVMFSTEGGVDIEEVAEKTPEKLVRHHVDALRGLSREEAVQIATDGQADADVVAGVADALVALYEVWLEEDATLAEINPLIVTPTTTSGGGAAAGEAGGRQVKALDAKVSLDGNALYRHPENQGLSDAENEDPIERRAKEQGVQYVALDGDIGILGNGAGLVMSTLDVVAQAGGSPANFLDAGGGSDAAKIKQAVELILSNVRVKAVLFNIFGGITRCDEVAKGLIAAFEDLKPSVPFVVRLDGTNDVAGRQLLSEAALPNVHPAATMNEAAEKVVALAKGQS